MFPTLLVSIAVAGGSQAAKTVQKRGIVQVSPNVAWMLAPEGRRLLATAASNALDGARVKMSASSVSNCPGSTFSIYMVSGKEQIHVI